MSNRRRFTFDIANFEGLIQNVFLIRKLSDAYDWNKVIDYDNSIMALMADVIKGFEEHLPCSTRKLIDTMANIQPTFNKSTISETITTLRRGEMFGLYIREQNCGFCLYFPQSYNDRAVVATFPASLPNQVILTSPNDVQVS